MSEISVFAFNSDAMRTIKINGEPWFVASDLAKILGYRDAPNMIRSLDDDERGVHIVDSPSLNQHGGCGTQETEVTIVNESGLYACILKSRRPEAKAFRKWVTSEVLPAIRKHGTYTAPGTFTTSNLSHGADLVVSADRTFRGFLRSARSSGLPLSDALRMANQQTRERTGLDMLDALQVDPDEMQAQATKSEPRPSAPQPAPDDPLQTALEQWALTAIDGQEYSIEEILCAACSLAPGDRRLRGFSTLAGPILRRLGFKRRKHPLRRVNLWYIFR